MANKAKAHKDSGYQSEPIIGQEHTLIITATETGRNNNVYLLLFVVNFNNFIIGLKKKTRPITPVLTRTERKALCAERTANEP